MLDDQQGRSVGNQLPRAFWVLWVGTIALRLGTVVQPFLALYLTESQGMSAPHAGAVLGIIGAGGLISQLVGGALADRIGRRATLTTSVIATGVVMLALGYVHTIAAIVTLAFLLGLTLDMYRPASQALIADLVPPRARARAFGLLVWAINLGFALAMVLGGTLAHRGFTYLCWANALACAAFAAIVWLFLPETRESHVEQSGSEGFRAVLRDHIMMTFVLLMLAYSFVFMQAFSTLPIAMQADGLGARSYGLIMAANGIVVIALQPFASRVIGHLDNHVVLAGGILLVASGYGLTTFASTAPTYLAPVMVWSLGEIVVFAVATTIVADLSPRDLRGRYNGIYGLGWAGGSLLAPLCGAQLLGNGGPLVLWPVCSAICLAAAAGHLLLAPAIRQRTGLAPIPD